MNKEIIQTTVPARGRIFAMTKLLQLLAVAALVAILLDTYTVQHALDYFRNSINYGVASECQAYTDSIIK